MSELDELRKENKRLKGLLKNAVELLNKSKEFLTAPDQRVVRKKKRKSSKK
jgi:hypothetical protein